MKRIHQCIVEFDTWFRIVHGSQWMLLCHKNVMLFDRCTTHSMCVHTIVSSDCEQSILSLSLSHMKHTISLLLAKQTYTQAPLPYRILREYCTERERISVSARYDLTKINRTKKNRKKEFSIVIESIVSWMREIERIWSVVWCVYAYFFIFSSFRLFHSILWCETFF